MTITYLSGKAMEGLSSDTKPTNVQTNSTFRETDTNIIYIFTSGAWTETFNTTLPYSYIIYKAGSIYKAKNGSTGLTQFTDSTPDVGALTQSCVNAMSRGGNIGYTNDSFTIQSVVTLPTANSGNAKPFGFEGVRTHTRTWGTSFAVGASFPTGRYMFEGIASAGSGNTATITLRGLAAYNNTYARSGTTNQSISAGSTVIDAGLVKIDSDNNIGMPVFIENIFTQYLWRGVHLIGYLYWPVIRNYQNADQNTNIVSDTQIIMEKGTHTDYPKGGSFEHIILNTIAGQGAGTGSWNNAIVFGGGYHNARQIFVDGAKYNNSVFGFLQCFSSSFYGIGSIDLNSNATQGSGYKGVFLFDSYDFSGNAPVHTPGEYTTFNNQLYDIYGSGSPMTTVYFANSAFRNRIRLYAYWGLANVIINDAGAGVDNIIELIEGQQLAATNSTKITTTNGIVNILDRRNGSENRGLFTANGDGSTKVFNIPHGVWTTPSTYNVERLSQDAQGGIDVTVTPTNIVVTYLGLAPPSGTNNIKLAWYANIY